MLATHHDRRTKRQEKEEIVIEIRSLQPFCPVLATCDAGRVDATLAALGRTRDEVVIVSEPARTAPEEAQDDLREIRESEEDARAEIKSLEREVMECRSVAATARHDTADARRERDDLAKENAKLRAELDTLQRLTSNQLAIGGGI